MSGPGADLLDWTLVRFQVENLKVLIRACLTKAPIEELYGHLVSLPRELALDNQGLAEAESPEDFVRLVPKGLLRENLEKALEIYRDYPRPFFFEAALDRGYFQGLVARTEELSQEDREIVKPMVYQEVDIFHLMLVARGKFHYNLTPEMLRPLHVAGTRITRALFAAMLNDPDLYTSAGRVAERVLDAAPFEHGPKMDRWLLMPQPWRVLRGSDSFVWPTWPFVRATWGWGQLWAMWDFVVWKWPISSRFPRGFAVAWLPRQSVDV